MMRPRVGFLGVGWIGRHRMAAMVETGAIEAAAIADVSPECLEEAAKIAPDAQRAGSFEELLELPLDALVIATPSALHAAQAIATLGRGMAVFCQKPLGRSEAEARSVIEAARQANRLLGVDMSYRRTAAGEAIAGRIKDGSLGRIFAADLQFHNAYGPDKAWFRDPALAGGGCLMDLGVHLLDLALLALDYPAIESVSSRLYSRGEPLPPDGSVVEDYATAELQLSGGIALRLACSWHLHAGRDAVIDLSFYGTQGGVAFRNLGGSFYDFEALSFSGTHTETLCSPPDEWGGREAAVWAGQLAVRREYDPAVERVLAPAEALDRIYAAAGAGGKAAT